MFLTLSIPTLLLLAPSLRVWYPFRPMEGLMNGVTDGATNRETNGLNDGATDGVTNRVTEHRQSD